MVAINSHFAGFTWFYIYFEVYYIVPLMSQKQYSNQVIFDAQFRESTVATHPETSDGEMETEWSELL